MMKPIPWILMFAALSVFAMGCAENPEPKNAADYNAASPNAPPPGVTSGEQAKVDSNPPAPPPQPQPQPPSARYQGIECEYNGETRRVSDGETFVIKKEQQFYCYSFGANPDCGNVSVSGMTKATKAGICQLGFLPIEQNASGTQDVTIDVGGTKVSFKVQVSGGDYQPVGYKAKKKAK